MTITEQAPDVTLLCRRQAEFRIDVSPDGGDGLTFEGHAAVFGQPTVISGGEAKGAPGGRFIEELSPGAFRKTLEDYAASGRMPVMQFNHGMDSRYGQEPIGVYTSMYEDDIGLFVAGRMNPHFESLLHSIRSGAIDSMSFTFAAVREDWNKDAEVWHRTLREVRLFEAGPVVWPAYPGTDAGLRYRAAVLFPTTDVPEIAPRDSAHPIEADNDAPRDSAHPSSSERPHARYVDSFRARFLKGDGK